MRYSILLWRTLVEENKKKIVLKCDVDFSKKFVNSPVDIIIPFHSLYKQVTDLVKSIILKTKSNPYKITLVDDFSDNVSFYEEIKNYKEINVFRTERKLGFGGALEHGFRLTKQPWVVFLHSDCLIENSDWLIEMGKSLIELKKNNVRLVSAKSNNPGFDYDKRLKSEKDNKTNDFITDSPLPLYCCMSHRELYKKINGFVKNYPYKGYEEEELFYRMKKYGYKQAICGKSWVNHRGSLTLIELIKKDSKVKEVIENNRNLCINDIKKLN